MQGIPPPPGQIGRSLALWICETGARPYPRRSAYPLAQIPGRWQVDPSPELPSRDRCLPGCDCPRQHSLEIGARLKPFPVSLCPYLLHQRGGQPPIDFHTLGLAAWHSNERKRALPIVACCPRLFNRINGVHSHDHQDVRQMRSTPGPSSQFPLSRRRHP